LSSEGTSLLFDKKPRETPQFKQPPPRIIREQVDLTPILERLNQIEATLKALVAHLENMDATFIKERQFLDVAIKRLEKG
jgi:hypothetical protein